jgi:hypothetical protein
MLYTQETDWERCSGWIEAALAKSGATHSIEDVKEAVEDGRVQFWPGENCALVTEVLHYPAAKRVRVWLAGGELKEIGSMLRMGERWAEMIGADGIEVVGRKGWAKVLEDRGFHEEAVYLLKEL